ncbi:MAG: hypothetical protein AB1705_18585 [Verrucomicrobiota bacterium]
MKEAFDDEKYYTSDQDFGGFAVRNYRKVVRTYSYERYEQRFRQLAGSRRLTSQQRPKISVEQFQLLMNELTTSLGRVGEGSFLKDSRNRKLADRLLMTGLFDEDTD